MTKDATKTLPTQCITSTVLASGNKYLKIWLLFYNHPTNEKHPLISRYFMPDTSAAVV